MNPKSVLPTEAPETGPQPSPFEKIVTNRSFVLTCAAVIVVVLVAYIAVAATRQAKQNSDNRAWGAFFDGLQQLTTQARNEGVFFTPANAEFYQALDPDFQIRVFNDVLQSVEGTSAEPVTLYYLGNAYLAARKLDQATRTFETLRSDYPDHYLVNAEKTYLNQTLVDQVTKVLEQEKKFLADNPDFLKGIKATEDTDVEGSNDPGSEDEGDTDSDDDTTEEGNGDGSE